MRDLSDILNANKEFAMEFIRDTGDIDTMAVLHFPVGSFPLGLNFSTPEEKVAVREEFKKGVSDTGAEVVSVMFTAWMSIRDSHPGKEFRPSEDPNRIEVLVVSVFSNDGAAMNEIHRILRGRDGNVLGFEKEDTSGEMIDNEWNPFGFDPSNMKLH
jgi:hypothetical protein